MAFLDKIEANIGKLSIYNSFIVSVAFYTLLVFFFGAYSLLRLSFYPQFDFNTMLYGIFIDSTVCAGLTMSVLFILSDFLNILKESGWKETLTDVGEVGLAACLTLILFYFLPFDLITTTLFQNQIFIINLPFTVLQIFDYLLVSYLVMRLSLVLDRFVGSFKELKVLVGILLTLIVLIIERFASYGFDIKRWILGGGYSFLPTATALIFPFVLLAVVIFIYNRFSQNGE